MNQTNQDGIELYKLGQLSWPKRNRLFQSLVSSGEINDAAPWVQETALALSNEGIVSPPPWPKPTTTTMNFNEARKFNNGLIDLVSRADEQIDALKYGHLHHYRIGDRVASNGALATVLWVGLDSLGILDDNGHASLRFPSEVQGPLPNDRLPKVYVQGAARRVTGRSSRASRHNAEEERADWRREEDHAE